VASGARFAKGEHLALAMAAIGLRLVESLDHRPFRGAPGSFPSPISTSSRTPRRT
jgi:hypothetical protein